MPRLSAVLAWTWCLPNTLLSLAVAFVAVRFLGGAATPFRGSVVVRVPAMRRVGGVCLGHAILVAPEAPEELVLHEWGHYRQSLLLGPLYHLVIGLPSLSHAVWYRVFVDRGPGVRDRYFHFYTEAWADWLGGVYPRHRHLHAHWSGYAWAPALALAVAALTWRAFGHALGFPFTDTDALADVAFAREPLARQLVAPLTGGVGGDNANFWRPAAMVQFWLQRRLFGWDPTGWHAWSVALHATVSLLAAAVVRKAGGDRGTAAVAALLFCAHPLAWEVVPAVARNIDLLLGAAFFGSLLAVGTWAFLPLYLLALGAKEAAVLVLPLAAMLGPVRWGPALAVTVAWLAARWAVLGGAGGYGSAPNVTGALARGLVEPFFPSLSPLLAGVPQVVPVATVAGGLLALGRVLPRRRLLAFAAVLGLGWLLILGATGTYTRRSLYVPTLAACIPVAAALSSAFRARASLALIACGLYLAAWLHGSPALRRYWDWAESGRVAELFTAPSLYADLPPGTTLWLVDRPARVDADARRFRLWSSRRSLNNTMAAYSLQAWLDEHVPRGLRVRNLSSLSPLGNPRRYRADVARDGDAIVVSRPPADRTTATVDGFTVSGEADLRIVPTPALERPAVLLIWNPEGVERVVP